MRRIDAVPALLAGLAALSSLGSPSAAQGPERTHATCIQNVGLPTPDAPDRRVTLILRDGRIAEVLPADAEAPPGAHLVDGEGLTAMPAFLDAYTRKGVTTPTPVKDQDMPVSEASDVRVDMRIANRKGIQPAFRAVDALSVTPETSEPWRTSGFGAMLVAPSGELLAGSSALTATREAAPRDLVIAGDVFAHAAFRANGPGYPSTLMGYIAQLRQFFHDARWHDELERRHDEGRPGERPAFDADLTAGRALLRAEKVLACEANSARDVERWLGLADQFGLGVLFVGGNDASRVAETLAARDIPVVLTLEWGKEVEDPTAKDEAPEEDAPAEEEEASEPDAAEATDATAVEAAGDAGDAVAAEEAASDETAEASDDEPNWIYEEPLAVRIEQRRLWEERRDVALHLAEHDVRFAFGTADETPKKLLGKVRDLVEAGLPREAALAALTTESARLLGVERRLGRIATGFDATLTLWTADPLTEKDAQVAWLFVDGFGSEFEVEEPDPAAQGEPQDAAGTWTLTTEMMGESRESTLVLVQDDDGGLTGTLTYQSMDGEEETTSLSGQVRGATLEVSGSMSFGDTSGSISIEGSFEGNALDATATYRFPFSEEPFEAEVGGQRIPEVLWELRVREESCHEDHAHGEGH